MARLFLIILVLSAYSLFSQSNFKKVYFSDNWESEINDVIRVDSSWILCGGHMDCTEAFILKIEDNGVRSWLKKPLTGGAFSFATGILKLHDDNILCAIKNYVAFDVSGLEHTFITKIKPNGDTLFNTRINQFDNSFKNTPLLEIDSSIYIAINDSIHVLSEQGDSTFSFHLNQGRINHLNKNKVFPLIISADNGLFILDSLFNTIKTKTFLNPVDYTYTMRDSAFVSLSGLQLWKLDSNLTVVDSLRMDTVFENVSDFIKTEKALFLTGKGLNGKTRIVHLDSDFQRQNTLEFNLPELTPGQLAHHQGNILMTGKDAFAPGNTSFVFVPDTAGVNQASDYDFAIKSINYLSTEVGYWSDLFSKYTYTTAFEIENKGIERIDSYYVKSEVLYRQQCTEQALREKSIRSIQPGETILDTFQITKYGPYWYPGEQVCFTILSPNDELDNDRSDNSNCVDVPVAIEDFNAEQKLEVYPNPFSNRIILEFTKEINHQISVFSTDGKTIFEKEINQKKEEVLTDKWPQGIYFINISDGNRSYTRKLFKAHP